MFCPIRPVENVFMLTLYLTSIKERPLHQQKYLVNIRGLGRVGMAWISLKPYIFKTSILHHCNPLAYLGFYVWGCWIVCAQSAHTIFADYNYFQLTTPIRAAFARTGRGLLQGVYRRIIMKRVSYSFHVYV